MEEQAKNRLAAAVMAAALLENAGLIWYATAGIIADQRSGTDMPFGVLFGLLFYLAIGISMVSAWVFFHRAGRTIRGVPERLIWTGVAILLAPWTTLLSFLPAYWFGPPGWLLALCLGGTSPYFLIGAALWM